MVYRMKVAGLERDLPLCPISDELYIGAFILFGDVELTEKCAEALYEKAPEHDVMLTADLMVGFPGESEDDFVDTVNFVREARLLDAHVFAYSKRGGTPAALYPNQVDEQTKQERSRALIAEVERVKNATLDRMVKENSRLSVIFETARDGGYVGHSAEYAEVFVKTDVDLRGEMLDVSPLRRDGGIIIGELVK